MSTNKEEFVSLFDFLGKPAGSETGKQVYAAAKKAGEKVNNQSVSNKKFTGKVLTYRRGFLDIYFAVSTPTFAS
jgi:hypothetical protein